MPEEEYAWLARKDLLSFEEIGQLVDVFTGLGVDRVRLTGGEPLLRRDLTELVRLLTARPGIREVALTTNGIRLAEHAASLLDAGLSRVTVSLDTLRADRFQAIARREGIERVIDGLEELQRLRARDTKIDTVVMRGVNDDELMDMLDAGARHDAEVRFIEYMDVGGATRWSQEQVVSRAELLARIEAERGLPEPVDEQSSAPADRWRLPDGTTFGIISSTTQPFCGSCDRSRLTADGRWLRCLYALVGTDLRGPLRAGADRGELAELISGTWRERDDRGAEERLAAAERGALAGPDELRDNPHLEMHTRGG
jgi:cyclic pyranopterin phosphate synthase